MQTFLKNLVYLFAFITLVFASSCQDDTETPINPTDPEEALVAQLELDIEQLELSVGKLNQGLGSAKVYDLIGKAPTKEAFIEAIIDESHSIFVAHANTDQQHKDWINLLTDSQTGQAMTQADYMKKVALSGNSDPLATMAELSLELLNKKKGSSPNGIVISKWQPTQEATPVSLSFPNDALELLIKKMEELGNAQSDREEEMLLDDIVKILDDSDAEPIIIGLLLPAVQKVREAAGKGQTKELPESGFVDWYGGIVGPTVGGGLDRDIIRRVQATAMLGSIHRAMSNGYDSSDPRKAQFQLYHAQYIAAVAAVGNALYVDPQ